jgi:hypothetical protein
MGPEELEQLQEKIRPEEVLLSGQSMPAPITA